ncbi:NADPH-dependent F420 reductase [Leifsonia sp. YAF41]|uniref:NADPH-dependent F420 reductase n=1 Tax=Leifsonia sp. YAF41 TaxID=3233086 RepID=UPI003F98EE51
MTTLGIVGAGHIGSQLARLGVASGYNVVLSNSRGPETLSGLVAELGPKARAATSAVAASTGDLVIVTIPLRRIEELPSAAFAGKVVIDTNNYYPQRDGAIAALDDESTTSSELLQAHLPNAHVVKAFNHIYASELLTDGSPAGTPNRRALVVAGDSAAARHAASALINEFGFDTLDLGSLAEGWRIQRDTPGYGLRMNLDELRAAVDAAERYRDMS